MTISLHTRRQRARRAGAARPPVPHTAQAQHRPQPPRSTPAHRPRGFTLVELLVALAVMALLAIVSWRGLDGMVRAQQITRERADAVLELQTVLAQWGADQIGRASCRERV